MSGISKEKFKVVILPYRDFGVAFGQRLWPCKKLGHRGEDRLARVRNGGCGCATVSGTTKVFARLELNQLGLERGKRGSIIDYVIPVCHF
jgi:hypothetical protein